MRLMTATRAAWNTFVRVYSDPGIVAKERSQSDRAKDHSFLWSYYKNYAFNPDYNFDWDGYRQRHSLYQHTRLVYNPVPTICAFYIDHVFPGVTAKTIGEAKDNLFLVTPVAEGAEDNLLAAIAQLDQWGNWLGEATRIVKYGSVIGSVLVEVDDDLEREKVIHRIVWPSLVKEKELDSTGNLKSYSLEYKAFDGDKEYLYRKEVDDREFRYFRDDRAWTPPGKRSPVEPNPYGFVPAVWIKHEDDGVTEGSPAVWNIEKVDRLNSDACHAHDYFHKVISSHKVISTDSDVVPITGAVGTTKNGGYISPSDLRTDTMILKTGAGASVHDIISTLDLGAAHPYIKDLRESFEVDYPELQARTIIQNNTQTSGAALERMLAPSQSKLDRASGNYNQQIIKLKQMQVAIAGWRTKNGWTRRDAQQDRFNEFGLDSYSRGELNFGLKRSLLIELTEMERLEVEAKKLENATSSQGIFSEDKILENYGISDPKERQAILNARRSVDVIPTENQ